MKQRAGSPQRRPAASGFDASTLRATLVILVAVKVLALCVAFDPFGQDSFELPKSLASRALEWLIAGTLVIAVLRYGAAIVPRSRIWAFVAAYLVANVVSAALAVNGYVALFGEASRYLGLTFTFDMTILAIAVAVSYRTPRDWAVLATAVVVASALASAYALVQFAGRDPYPWTVDNRLRPFGTFGNPNMFGQFLSASFGAALGVVLTSRGSRRSRALILVLLTVALIGGVATRGSILGVLVALGLTPVVLAGLGRLRSLPRRAVAGGLGGAVLVVAAIWISPLGRRIESTLAGAELQDRVVIYAGAVRAFAARPLVGWGPDSFAVAYPTSRLERSAGYEGGNSLSSSAHDLVLQLAVTTGGLGLVTYVALLGVCVWILYRRGLRDRPAVAAPLLLALSAYLAHGLVTVGSVSVDWLPWVAVGGAASLEPAIANESSRRQLPAVLYLAIAAASLLGASSGVVAMLANHDAWFASHNLSPERAAVAERAAEEATRLDAGRAAYWNLLGDVRALAGKPREAADAHAEAARRAPHLAGYLASVALDRAHEAAAGDLRDGGAATAFATAERAISIDPYLPVGHATLATIASLFGQYDRAMDEATRATDLYPFTPGFDRLLASSALRASDRAAARAILVRTLNVNNTAPLNVALGTMDLDDGDRASAHTYAGRALRLDPTSEDAKQLGKRLAQGLQR